MWRRAETLLSKTAGAGPVKQDTLRLSLLRPGQLMTGGWECSDEACCSTTSAASTSSA